MRRVIRTAVLTVAVMCLLPAGASGIVAGDLDGNAHPNVGMLALEDDLGGFFCSGTLVAPQVVLTAGHCVIGVTEAQVSFDSVAPPLPGEPGSEGHFITGTPYAHPGFGMRNGHGYNDIGVVVLDAPATTLWAGIQPAPLPPADALTESWADGSLRDATFTLVGYGAYENHGTAATFDPVVRRRTDVTVASLAAKSSSSTLRPGTGAEAAAPASGTPAGLRSSGPP